MARSSPATKTARWGFHSGCPTEAPPRQHFCTQSARPGFVCSAPQASSLIQPAREAFFCCAESDPSATRPQTSNKTRTIQRLVIFFTPASTTRLHACSTQIRLRGLRPVHAPANSALGATGQPSDASFRKHDVLLDEPEIRLAVGFPVHPATRRVSEMTRRRAGRLLRAPSLRGRGPDVNPEDGFVWSRHEGGLWRQG